MALILDRPRHESDRMIRQRLFDCLADRGVEELLRIGRKAVVAMPSTASKSESGESGHSASHRRRSLHARGAVAPTASCSHDEFSTLLRFQTQPLFAQLSIASYQKQAEHRHNGGFAAGNTTYGGRDGISGAPRR